MNTQNNNGPSGTDFGPVIYSYTRAQAVADGVQVDVTKTAQEAGTSRQWPCEANRNIRPETSRDN